MRNDRLALVTLLLSAAAVAVAVLTSERPGQPPRTAEAVAELRSTPDMRPMQPTEAAAVEPEVDANVAPWAPTMADSVERWLRGEPRRDLGFGRWAAQAVAWLRPVAAWAFAGRPAPAAVEADTPTSLAVDDGVGRIEESGPSVESEPSRLPAQVGRVEASVGVEPQPELAVKSLS